MTGLILAVEEPRASALARELELEGEHIIAIVSATSATSATTLLSGAQALVMPASRETLTPYPILIFPPARRFNRSSILCWSLR